MQIQQNGWNPQRVMQLLKPKTLRQFSYHHILKDRNISLRCSRQEDGGIITPSHCICKSVCGRHQGRSALFRSVSTSSGTMGGSFSALIAESSWGREREVTGWDAGDLEFIIVVYMTTLFASYSSYIHQVQRFNLPCIIYIYRPYICATIVKHICECAFTNEPQRKTFLRQFTDNMYFWTNW